MKTQRKHWKNLLGVKKFTISARLHAMGKIQKEGKWLLHELTENAIANRLNISISLLARQRKKSFLWREMKSGFISTTQNIKNHGWIMGESRSVIDIEPKTKHPRTLCSVFSEIWRTWYITSCWIRIKQSIAERYRDQLEYLNANLMQKWSSVISNRWKVILLHDNARPHVALAVKQKLLELKWEILPHPVYSPDLTLSDYHIFCLMQHDLEDIHFANYGEVKNGLLNGSTQKTSRSIDAESNFCQ